MRRGGDGNVLLAVVGAGVTTLALGAGSVWWMDDVLGGWLRGTDWDFLLIIPVVLIICGATYVWLKIYIWIMELLEGKEP